MPLLEPVTMKTLPSCAGMSFDSQKCLLLGSGLLLPTLLVMAEGAVAEVEALVVWALCLMLSRQGSAGLAVKGRTCTGVPLSWAASEQAFVWLKQRRLMCVVMS